MPATDETLSTRRLNRATLARQMLLTRHAIAPIDAVGRLVGLQAQVARPPFIGLWSRMENASRAQLVGLVRDRSLVRATAMRATLHMMTADDYVALRGALQPALRRGIQSVLRERTKGLDYEALEAVARSFFATGANFDDLRTHLKEHYPNGDERAMAYTVRLNVPLVQMPTDAPWGYPAQSDFVIADRWLGRRISTAEAPAHELIRRYLAAFGPAAVADVQAWSALQGLRQTLEEMRPSLVTFRDARNRELFDLPEAPRPDEDVPAPPRFLPEYDNLVLSHDDRTRVIADEHRPRVVLKNLQVRATFLLDGIVAGTWKIERKRKTAALIIEPFGKVTKKNIAALEAEGDALLRFAEEDAPTREIRWEA